MKTSRVLSVVASLVLLISYPQQVHAAFLNNATGIGSPAVTITFDEFVFANDTVIINQYSSLGVTFSPNLYYNPQVTAFPNITGNRLGNFNPVVDPFNLNFSTLQNSAAFAFVSNPGTTIFSAYLGATLVETFSIATSPSSSVNYYGFTGISFDSIRIDVGGGNNSMLLDNLQMGAAVPEPSTYIAGALLLLPFGAQVVRRLRTRRQVA